jgi:hypothetical protein
MYWLEPAGNQRFSIGLLETEEQARQAAPPVSRWNAPSVTIKDAEVMRVAATAESFARKSGSADDHNSRSER